MGTAADAQTMIQKNDIKEVTLELRVDEDDMGKVIGRQGRIAKAMRTVVKAAATRENKKVSVDII
uniref:KH domain-containing protein n=1 Tax=Mitsuokella jalaludinii TaxID=187979 RepID=UPI003C6D8522